MRKVVATGILPRINTGIAHKEPGIGMVGAGLLQAPKECFLEAFEARQICSQPWLHLAHHKQRRVNP